VRRIADHEGAWGVANWMFAVGIGSTLAGLATAKYVRSCRLLSGSTCLAGRPAEARSDMGQANGGHHESPFCGCGENWTNEQSALQASNECVIAHAVSFVAMPWPAG
jgi:hypothetical protein